MWAKNFILAFQWKWSYHVIVEDSQISMWMMYCGITLSLLRMLFSHVHFTNLYCEQKTQLKRYVSVWKFCKDIHCICFLRCNLLYNNTVVFQRLTVYLIRVPVLESASLPQNCLPFLEGKTLNICIITHIT